MVTTHELKSRLESTLRPVAKSVVVGTSPLWDPVYRWWFRRSTFHRGPIPPFANRRRVAAWRLPYFFASGVANHDDLERAFREHLDSDLSNLSVLDLAGGPGRIAQYFTGVFAELTLCDVDPSAIDYVRNRLEGVNALVSRSEPPLPFPSDRFDVVYSWSLLTHLPAEMQVQYLDEIKRILRPGGWAFVTTNGHAFLDAYQAYPRSEPWWRQVTHEQLRKEGLIYHPYVLPARARATALRGISGPFGLSLHDPEFIRREWSSRLEVAAIQEELSNKQDLVVLRAAGPTGEDEVEPRQRR